MGTMFKSLIDPEVRSEMTAWPWAFVLLCLLPALLASSMLATVAPLGRLA